MISSVANTELQEQLPTESELVAQVLANVPGAFEQLMQPYEKAIRNYLQRHLRNEADAEDVYQELCVQVFRKLELFNTTKRFQPWLYAIASRKIIDYIRSRGKGINQGKASLFSIDNLEAWQLEDVDATDLNVLNNAIKAEEAALLRQKVASMQEVYRQAIESVYFNGLLYKEAADVLGIPVGTIKSRLHSAIKNLSDDYLKTDRHNESK